MTKSIFATIFLAVALTGAAEVRWTAKSHDFGAFDEEMGPVECEFVFVNTGSEPIAITGARSSCGCTTPKYTREPIAPGDSGRITVTYDPAGRPGRFEKSVGVDFSDRNDNAKLHIRGTVVGASASVSQRFPVECTEGLRLAKSVVMFGEVMKGQLRSVFLQGYNQTSVPVEPKVSGLPPYMDVTVTPATVPPGEQFSFVFYMRSDKCPLYGFVGDTARVEFGNGNCELSLTAVVKEDFSKLTDKEMKKSPIARLEEQSLDFGTLSADVEQRTMRIKNLGKSPLLLRRVYTGDPGVEVSVEKTTVKPGKEALVTVTVHRDQLPGALLNARIQVITNDPISPVQTLRAVGKK